MLGGKFANGTATAAFASIVSGIAGGGASASDEARGREILGGNPLSDNATSLRGGSVLAQNADGLGLSPEKLETLNVSLDGIGGTKHGRFKLGRISADRPLLVSITRVLAMVNI